MDLWQLHVFCRVVEQKSFSKAGSAVHLSQPTVSSHIKDLEDHFGCVLIDRLGKEALPTKAGDLLYRYARKLLAMRDATESAMAEFQGKIKGRLAIGGSTIPGGYILPRLIGEFNVHYPEVTVSLTVGDTEFIIAEILSGELEIGIVGAVTGNKKIVQRKLLDDDMHLIIPPEHKWANRKAIELHDLLEEPFIVREKGSGTLKSINNRLEEMNLSMENLKIAAEMGSTTAVIQGVKQHVGISIISAIAIADELNSGTLQALRVKGMNLKRSFYLAHHKLRSLSPLGEAFMLFLEGMKTESV
ncbi:MAG: selenium metabolism-associated LysR family transcriptional regulator [Desulfobacterales bacterium]